MLNRRHSITVRVGDISVGSSHPVVVQSMTNTDTTDLKATVSQIIELAEAGSELVRITVIGSLDERKSIMSTRNNYWFDGGCIELM